VILNKHNLHIATPGIPLMTTDLGIYLTLDLHTACSPVDVLVPYVMYLMICGESIWNLALALENYKVGHKVAFAEAAVGRAAVVY